MPFVAFEGLDGSGKSTLIQGLAAELQRRKCAVTVTREPGGTPLGEEIRKLLLESGPRAPVPRAELLLYEAGRAQHVEQVIRPALLRGDWVICDRFTASSLAFQCGGRSLSEEQVSWLNHYATSGLEPDLSVLLNVSVSTSEKRRASRVLADRFESEKQEFHQRVYDHYLTQVQRAPKKWLVIEGESKSPSELGVILLEALLTRRWL